MLSRNAARSLLREVQFPGKFHAAESIKNGRYMRCLPTSGIQATKTPPTSLPCQGSGSVGWVGLISLQNGQGRLLAVPHGVGGAAMWAGLLDCCFAHSPQSILAKDGGEEERMVAAAIEIQRVWKGHRIR